MTCLVSALKQRCGVRYDPRKVDAKLTDAFDLHDSFIHGVIQGPGGTCATLPVVYASVARRLGYPLKLVHTKGHLFNRWDDAITGERINVEGSTGGRGISTHPDEHYGRNWRHPVSAEEARWGGYLESHSPREELANFVARRACRWQDVGNYRDAVECFILAADLDVWHVTFPQTVDAVTEEWNQKLRRRFPPGVTRLEIGLDSRRRWPNMPAELERKIRVLDAADRILSRPRPLP
jgi:hypothetical protein